MYDVDLSAYDFLPAGLAQLFTTSLSVREVWALIPGPVKLAQSCQRLATAAEMDPANRYTVRRKTISTMEIYFDFFDTFCGTPCAL